jgi:hypothetical protein
MRNRLLVALVLWLLPSAAFGWNEKGHMVVARLAWLKLDPAARRAATEILKQHPHYDEFLTAECPPGFCVDEWVFMRAAYWSDWIRSNHTEEFSKPTWHYLSVAFVPPHSKKSASDLQRNDPNVVTQIPASMDKVRSAQGGERAVALCWVLHLIGDIHQPLHCCSQLCEKFPEGDRGGNLAIVRLNGGMAVNLHFAWDAMLGEDFSLSEVLKTVADLQRLESQHACEIQRAVQAHPTSADWARESFENARTHAYLNGDLRPGHAGNEPEVDPAPNLSEAYVQNAASVARLAVVRAGCRLAAAVSNSVK